jgi:hypothetical protein
VTSIEIRIVAVTAPSAAGASAVELRDRLCSSA